jgi:cyanophycinase
MTRRKLAKPKTSKKRNGSRLGGSLIVIGGSEDKLGDKKILCEIANRVGNGKLIMVTVASEIPEEIWSVYDEIFRYLGVRRIEHVGLIHREQLLKDPHLEVFNDASVIFFSGGDQLKLTSALGGTRIIERIYELFRSGGTIAGTSAGATAIGEIMLFGSPNGSNDKFELAPGLRLLPGTIIDQHFAQRHRLIRLLGAVAQNPAMLGIGIDEDTAIVVEQNSFRVIGTHSVYVIDGRGITSSNVSEVQQNRQSTVCLFDARLHILAEGNSFDLSARRPQIHELRGEMT